MIDRITEWYVWPPELAICTVIYCTCVGIICGIVFLIGSMLAAPQFSKNRGIFYRRVGRLALFLFVFLIIGAFFNCLWTMAVFGRLYYSTDYCGIDFMPFWPITQGTIDMPFGDERGKLLGISLLQLQGMWFLFAMSTWAITFLIYRFLISKWERRGNKTRSLGSALSPITN